MAKKKKQIENKKLPIFNLGGNIDLSAYGDSTGGELRAENLEKKRIENLDVSAGEKMKWFAAGQLAPALEWFGMDEPGKKWEEKAAKSGAGRAYTVGSGIGEIGSAVGKYFTGDYQGMAGDLTESAGDFTKTRGYGLQKKGNWGKGDKVLEAGKTMESIGGVVSSSSGMGYNNMGKGMSKGNMGSMFGGKGSSTEGMGNLPETGSFNLNNSDINSFQGTNFAAYGADITPSIQNIEGPSHANGGVPLDTNDDNMPDIEAEGGETTDGQFIFSNRLTPFGSKKTFADISKSIEKKYTKGNSLSDKTKSFELEMLKDENRKVKSIKEQEQAQLMGPSPDQNLMPKFWNGGDEFSLTGNDKELGNINSSTFWNYNSPVFNQPTATDNINGFKINTDNEGNYIALPNNDGTNLRVNVKGINANPSTTNNISSTDYSNLVPLQSNNNIYAPGSYSDNDINNDGVPDITSNPFDTRNSNRINRKDIFRNTARNENKNETSTGGTSISKGDKWQLAGSAIGPATNAALLISDIAQKPEQVKRKYDNSPITKMHLDKREGIKEIGQQFASLKDALKGNARNFNVVANNLQGAMGKTQEGISKHSNQIDMANKELDIKHEQRSQEQLRTNIKLFNNYEQQDAQNRAARRNAIRQDVQYLSDTSSQGAKNVGDIMNSSLNNEAKLRILNEAFPQYKINADNMKEFWKNMSSKDKEDLVKFIGGFK